MFSTVQLKYRLYNCCCFCNWEWEVHPPCNAVYIYAHSRTCIVQDVPCFSTYQFITVYTMYFKIVCGSGRHTEREGCLLYDRLGVLQSPVTLKMLHFILVPGNLRVHQSSLYICPMLHHTSHPTVQYVFCVELHGTY